MPIPLAVPVLAVAGLFAWMFGKKSSSSATPKPGPKPDVKGVLPVAGYASPPGHQWTYQIDGDNDGTPSALAKKVTGSTDATALYAANKDKLTPYVPATPGTSAPLDFEFTNFSGPSNPAADPNTFMTVSGRVWEYVSPVADAYAGYPDDPSGEDSQYWAHETPLGMSMPSGTKYRFLAKFPDGTTHYRSWDTRTVDSFRDDAGTWSPAGTVWAYDYSRIPKMYRYRSAKPGTATYKPPMGTTPGAWFPTGGTPGKPASGGNFVSWNIGDIVNLPTSWNKFIDQTGAYCPKAPAGCPWPPDPRTPPYTG